LTRCVDADAVAFAALMLVYYAMVHWEQLERLRRLGTGGR
jgi:hypothetical protein